MRRIAPNDHKVSTHPEANKWLTGFMLDIKKMVLLKDKYPNYQPFTVERLDEWTEVHAHDVGECVMWPSDMVKHISNDPIPEHMNAISTITGLVLDLRLLIAGHELREITPERIVEADDAYLEITRCRKRRTLFY